MIVIKMKETQISPSSDGSHGWPGEGVEWQGITIPVFLG